MFSAKNQGLIMQAVMKDKIASEAKRKQDSGDETKELIDLVSSDD